MVKIYIVKGIWEFVVIYYVEIVNLLLDWDV